MIEFKNPIIDKFVRREKRFFCYTTNYLSYCVNTGKMADILVPGAECIITQKEGGKLNYIWQAVKLNTWIGTNTMNPNLLVEKLLKKIFPKDIFKREVSFGKYRADFASETKIIEVKNVHWRVNDIAYFPDCITIRGTKQLEIINKLLIKYDCYVIYIVQRNDVEKCSIANFIDLNYYNESQKAHSLGLKYLAFNCNVSPKGIEINKEITFI